MEVVEAARIFAKEQSPDDNTSNSDTKEASAMKRAVQKFVMFLIQWPWNVSENKLDC